MAKPEDVKNFLNSMKQKLLQESYTETQLQLDFGQALALIWDELTDLWQDDLGLFSELQSYLIDQVCQIHQEEESPENGLLLKKNISVRKIASLLEDGKRAQYIYSFNDSEYISYLIGDIHSDTVSMERILQKTDFFAEVAAGKKIRLIFLGDYVDRGKAHLKLLYYILLLKYLFPKNIYLLRGNHDGGSYKNGQAQMWVKKPEQDLTEDWFLLYLVDLVKANPSFPEQLIDNYLKFFNSLGVVSFVKRGEKIFMLAHGGIPRPQKDSQNSFAHLDSLLSITDGKSKDCLGYSTANNIYWSDPAMDDNDLRLEKRRFRFTKAQFEEFRSLLDFDLLIRGHQVQEAGYKFFFDERILNIFSSGQIYENGENVNTETAYLRVVDPHIICLDQAGNPNFIPLNDFSVITK